MSYQLLYDQINTGFTSKRNELLEIICKAAPQLADTHKRKWRVIQLENAISDIKSTIAACNMQIDTERVTLDELSAENTRLNAQAAKLKDDLRLLEGVTGMKAVLPSEGDAEILSQINKYAENFREKSADFYFNMGQIKQKIIPDDRIEKESNMMLSSLQDFIDLHFNTRKTEVNMSREIDDLSIKTDELKGRLDEANITFSRKFRKQKKEAQDEYDKEQEDLVAKVRDLKMEYAVIQNNSANLQKKLNAKIDDLIEKEKVLDNRCKHLKSFNRSINENLRRRTIELELELDRFQNRLSVIRTNPNTVDKKLINMSLVLGEKSKLIFTAIKKMRAEIAELNQEIRSAY